MTLTPLLNAPAAVQFHAAAALLALGLGVYVLATPKGTPRHRMAGSVWAAVMMAVALSSFAITRSGHFSAIHILSVVTLIAIPRAIWSRRTGRIRGHAIGMIATFAGLLIAGAFTLAPGRIMHAVAFGG